jgi:lipid-binding SYLF domain-containing protein
MLGRSARCLSNLLATVFAFAAFVTLGGCEHSMITRAGDAAQVLRDFSISETPIPADGFSDAKAIAVLRDTDAGVVLNAVSGKGVMVSRTPSGWSAPIALDVIGGSLGAQIGATSRDVVMVFRSDAEVEKVTQNGTYALAEASALAGPSASSTGHDDNPVRTFVRASGLYAGARVGGIKFVVNDDVNHETYGLRYSTSDILAGKVERPLGTSDLYRQLPNPTPAPRRP